MRGTAECALNHISVVHPNFNKHWITEKHVLCTNPSTKFTLNECFGNNNLASDNPSNHPSNSVHTFTRVCVCRTPWSLDVRMPNAADPQHRSCANDFRQMSVQFLRSVSKECICHTSRGIDLALSVCGTCSSMMFCILHACLCILALACYRHTCHMSKGIVFGHPLCGTCSSTSLSTCDENLCIQLVVMSG